MVSEIFNRQKDEVLAGVDLSRKGSIDAPIVELTQFINSHRDLFTLSSCSGRVVILRETPVKEGQEVEEDNVGSEVEQEPALLDKRKKSGGKVRKFGCQWILVSHTEVETEKAVEVFNKRSEEAGCVVLKFEPFVLHVQARDLPMGRKVLLAATEAGFRNSGLTVGGRKGEKVVVAVRSTHGLEVPLTGEEGEVMVTKEYVEFVVNKANQKLRLNFKKIIKFEEHLRKVLTECEEAGDKLVKTVYRSRKKKDKSNSTDSQNYEEDLEIFDSLSLFQ